MKRLVVLAICLAVAGTVAAEDRLILKDGQVTTGRIVSETEAEVVIDTGEENVKVPAWAIERIERDESRPPREEGHSSALLSWIDVCIETLGSDDEIVRTSAIAALNKVGPAARPALERVTNSGEERVAAIAQRLLYRAKRLEEKGREPTAGSEGR